MSIRRIQMALLAVIFLLGSMSLALAQDKPVPEAYSAVARGTGGSVGGKTAQFDFRVTQYTTDDELANFAQLLKEKGTDALRRALEKEDKGRVNVVGSTGNQIAVVRKRQEGADTEIDAAPADVEGALPRVAGVGEQAAAAADAGIVEQKMDPVGLVLLGQFVAEVY